MYNEKVVEIFTNPKNVGEIKDANAIGQVGNPACAAAIVSSSVATEMIKGKTIEEALKLENQEILDYLGGLPAHKIHCSVLAKEAIESAIDNYNKKNK